jgi:DNA invertase Pin-like site-specific DNA recombinase
MVERTRRGKQRKAQEGRITTTRAAFGFDYNATRDGYVINPEQMEVVRRMFYMAGVEKMTIYATTRQKRWRRGDGKRSTGYSKTSSACGLVSTA